MSLFKTLYGQVPFHAESLRDLVAAKEHEAPQLPKSPRVPVRDSVRDALVRGLAPDPNDRWPEMRALLAALEPARRRNRSWWVAGLAISGTVAVALASASTATDAARLAVRLTGLIGDDLEDPDEGLMWSRQAEAWLDKSDDATLGDLRLQRGRIRYRQNDFEGALSDAIEAQDRTHLYAFVAMSHTALERRAEAVSAWRKAMRSAEEAGASPARMTHVRTELGKAYQALGDNREARRNLEIALEIGKAEPDAMTDERLEEITQLLEQL